MDGRIHGPHGIRWLPEPIDINNVNVTAQLENLEIVILSLIFYYDGFLTLQIEMHQCFMAEIGRVVVSTRAVLHDALAPVSTTRK